MRKLHVHPIKSKLICYFIAITLTGFFLNACKKDINNKIAQSPENEIQTGKKPSPDRYPGPCPYECDDIRCKNYEDYCGEPVITYAGVNITYEATNGILKFNSMSDVNTVIDQLDADYESYNTNYENQYPTLTEDQLDCVDQLNNFDEFRKFKDFENLFSGYTSKRSQIEATEITWLLNNFSGTDPDILDYTIADEENTVFNSNYQLKIGTTTYEMRSDGLYDISGGGQSMAVPMSTLDDCFTNRHKKTFIPHATNPDRKFKLKVAIHYFLIRSAAKGKVVSFKKNNNNNWKRSRSNMAVSCTGNVYDNTCTLEFPGISIRNPSPSGFKKRRQLKVVYRFWDTTKKQTKSGELGAGFSLSDNITGGVVVID